MDLDSDFGHDDRHRPADSDIPWIELFFDLVFIAALILAGDRLVEVERLGVGLAEAAPGPAGRPWARSLPAFRELPFCSVSNSGASIWVRCWGLIRDSASRRSISPSSTMSTATRTAAGPVRLPERVWSM